MRQSFAILFLLGTFFISNVHGQTIQKKNERCREEDIPHYTSYKTDKAPVIDGKLDEAVWVNADRSSRFVDMISGAETHLDTRAAVLWDDQYLYVAYWLEEPGITATHTQRDALIYQDNDAELFIAGPDGYYEFEINSFGTIYEVLFLWADTYEKKGYNKLPEFKRDADSVRIFNGVGYRHPRGSRIGFWNWDMPGLQSAVNIGGTVNDNADIDDGWTIEIAIPWSSLKVLANGDGRALPPKENDVWRMDFSRFNTKKGSTSDAGGWSWSSHGVWDSHVPECFTFIKFSEKIK